MGGRYLVGVDLGSTSLKSVVYDLRGSVVASGSRPTERFHPEPAHPEWTVWDPAQIWGGAAAAIRDALGRVPDPSQVAAVSVTGMGMDGVPVDEQGRWLYPFISWLCPRTEPQRAWWETTIGAEKTFSVGGNNLWPFSTALRLRWMAEHEPAILARTDKWLLIEDFLNFMLCGRRATDYSMASCTLLFDQRTRGWSSDLLGAADIPGRLLCDPKPSGTLLGEVHRAASAATGLPEGTPVVLGGHDYLCGALPVGALAPGVFLDVSGTWEVLQTTTSAPVLTPELQRIGATVECHVARDQYSVMTAAISAEMLEWYRRELGAEARTKAAARGCVDWETLMEEAAASPAGSRGVLFLPHMGGSGSPVVDSRSRGSFAGLRTTSTRGDLLRAVIEGVDFQLRDMIEEMKKNVGFEMTRLVVAGGAVRNGFWLQNKADVIGRAIEVPDVEDASPLGAAMLAGIGVGAYRDEADAFAQVSKPARTFEPDPAAADVYDRRFGIYRKLYPALRSVSHDLAETESS